MVEGTREQRRRYLVEQRRLGRTLKSLAHELALSPERIRQILHQGRAPRVWDVRDVHPSWPVAVPMPDASLSTRAWNGLVTVVTERPRQGLEPITTPAGLRARLRQGPYPRNCGRQTRQELLRWLETLTSPDTGGPRG